MSSYHVHFPKCVDGLICILFLVLMGLHYALLLHVIYKISAVFLLYYDICAGLQEALRVYVGTTSQCIHVADHVTYCYTVL